MTQQLPPSFCPMPWINLSTDVNGSLRPCCIFAQPSTSNEYQLPFMKEGNLDVLWNDVRVQQLRQAFLDGKKPTECRGCWDQEQAGIESLRVSNLKDLPADKAYPLITDIGPTKLDLKLNNVCNLKCRICGPQASSSYLKEHNERYNMIYGDSQYWLSNKILGTDNELVFKKWAKNLTHVEITGGEPMASPENIKILDLLIHAGNAENINIMLNTNGTLYNTALINRLLRFKKVILCISIDDIGDRLEYERYPTKWNDIQVNIKKYQALKLNNANLDISLCPTVSILNVYYLTEFLEWADPLNMYMFFNLLHYPASHCIKNLPGPLKTIVLERMKDERLASVAAFLQLKGDDTPLSSFINKNNELDAWRNQSFEKTFGLWGKIITEYNE